MAFLAAQAKAGFYPTPPEVVRRIAGCMVIGGAASGLARLLDPCCGTGEALAQLGALLRAGGTGAGIETYGIELHPARYAAARRILDHPLCADLFQASVAHDAFQLLYLNPPYDHDDEKRRQEHKFLLHATRALCPDGVLVFLVPQKRLALSARYLSAHYRRLACYRFPDPEYAAFQQVVLFGVKKEHPAPDAAAEEAIQAWAHGELPPLPDRSPDPYAVPTGDWGRVLLTRRSLDSAAVVAEARRSGLWASAELRDRLWPRESAVARPLMPLRRGHLAMLIAAGFLNNLTLEASGRRVLVKGRTYKEFVQVEVTDEAETYREVLRTSVVALDLATGEFLDIAT